MEVSNITVGDKMDFFNGTTDNWQCT